MRQVNCTINLSADTILYVLIIADNGEIVPCAADVPTDGRAALLFDDCVSPEGWGADLTVIAPGMAPWEGRMVLPTQPASEGPLITLVPGPNPFRVLPPPPSRAEVVSGRGSMQALCVETEQYGTIPYWEGILGWFSAEDRQRIYAAKHAKGDTHCGIQLSGAYREPGQFYANFPGKDWTQDLLGLLALCTEAIQAGFRVWLPLAGDGRSYDPGGLTYGYDWLMSNLAGILTALESIVPYTLFSPGYDGIIAYDETTQQFGPWTAEELSTFLVLFRQLAPQGYISVEPSAGPLGGTLANFLSAQAYDALDVILNECASPPNNDITWQSADRVLGPYFVRPPDMPTNDDPDAPFGPTSPKWTIRNPTSRGSIVPWGFEICTYQHVRGMPLATQQQQVAYVEACGYGSMG